MDVISNPSTFVEILGRLMLASLVGAALGMNREFRKKPAGFRTHILVAIGSALLTLVGLAMNVAAPSQELNALSRVVQGIIVGVGFIGGGAILRREDEKVVHGLSTAASIWVVAAGGVAAGCGMWRSALVAGALALLSLIGGEPIDRAIRSRGAGDEPEPRHPNL